MAPSTSPTTTADAAETSTTSSVETKLRRLPTPVSYRSPPSNYREDCWSSEETYALIDAWGSLHLSLNRGSLRQHQWSDVASAVNSAVSPNRRRTDAQCKNRIDTLKKRFKSEKAKLTGDDRYVSPWEYFSRLDYLIAGEDSPPLPPSVSEVVTPSISTFPVTPSISTFPVKRRSAIPKRPARWLTEDVDDVDDVENVSVKESAAAAEAEGFEDGCRMIAEAIRRLGEVYERVESNKNEQMIELEKHRMEFAKELELQRMKLLMDTQHQLLSRFKRTRHDHPAHADVGED